MNNKGKININEEFHTSALNLFKNIFQNPEKIEEKPKETDKCLWY